MISADTPPGTEVVCIRAAPGRYGPTGLTVGAVYTVAEVVEGLHGKPVVFVREVPALQGYEAPYGLMDVGFDLSRFRYLEIPRSLTGLLEGEPVQLDLELMLEC